jgi:hypothetical protein
MLEPTMDLVKAVSALIVGVLIHIVAVIVVPTPGATTVPALRVEQKIVDV